MIGHVHGVSLRSRKCQRRYFWAHLTRYRCPFHSVNPFFSMVLPGPRVPGILMGLATLQTPGRTIDSSTGRSGERCAGDGKHWEFGQPSAAFDAVSAAMRIGEATNHSTECPAQFAAAQREVFAGSYSSAFLGTTSVTFWINSCPSPESDCRLAPIASRANPVGEVSWGQSYFRVITLVAPT